MSRPSVAELEARLENAPAGFQSWLALARLRNAAHQSTEALAAANNALILHPPSLEALFECGQAQLDLGLAGEAAASFITILEQQPVEPQVLISLGAAYSHLRRLDEAAVIWEQAARVAPDPVPVLEDLAVCHQRRRDLLKVAETWERVLRIDPQHPLALHHLAALGKRSKPDRAAGEYVARLFDEFAPDFEATLESLGYDGPRLLSGMVAEHHAVPAGGWDVLDAGCGTGLCGPYVRPWAKRLVGVDLSPRMLEKARAGGIYDGLECAEMIGFLEQQSKAFDLIIASDSINYFGALESVLKAMSGALKEGGRCVFFVERMEEETDEGFVLEYHGRYSHRTGYVTGCLDAAGLSVIARREEPVRSESGKTVVGVLFLAEKAPGW